MTGTSARGGTGDLHVALLRGVNVAGKNRLPMKELAAIFAGAGCRDVRTYIQSGNVVYAAGSALARRVPGIVSAALSSELGLHVPVVTRTAAELIGAARGNPFLKPGADPKALHVGFLLERPGKAAVASLDPHRSPHDRFAVQGREIYLHLPHGVAKSKLTTPYLDSRLGTTVTVRNWNTVLKLVEMVRG
jgi:uncharacterized protein (DUF1697 family)